VILYPAVDILGGKAVRLAQGRFDAQTVYDSDPLRAAQEWVDGGAQALHVVDLDGARSGAPGNLDHICRICDAVSLPVQLGGGIRTIAAARDAFAAGVDRVIIGTAALTDPSFLDQMVATYGQKMLVSVDARAGLVATAGWTQTTNVEAKVVIEDLQGRGVTNFVYSSIERDGMLAGPDLAEIAAVAQVITGSFIYSGGVASVDDLAALAQAEHANLSGVIVGTALFEGRFTIADGRAALAA